MASLVTLFIFLIGILDCIIFILFLENPKLIKEIMLVHTLLYLFIYNLENKYLKQTKGVPSYIAFFLPGIGGILVSGLYFSLDYFMRDSMVLEEYEQYIHYDRLLEDKKKLDYRKEVSTISFLDQMNLLDSESKKESIIEFDMNYYDGRINLLQKGLVDQDGEVKHYTAVTLNMIENEFSIIINQLKEEFNTKKDIRILVKLSEVYKSYIESGLLSSEVLSAFNLEYIDVLNKLIESKKETLKIMNELVKAYIRDKNFKQAEKVNDNLLKKYTDKFDGIFNKIQIAYEKKDFYELNNLIMNLDNREDIPKEYEKILSFWR